MNKNNHIRKPSNGNLITPSTKLSMVNYTKASRSISRDVINIYPPGTSRNVNINLNFIVNNNKNINADKTSRFNINSNENNINDNNKRSSFLQTSRLNGIMEDKNKMNKTSKIFINLLFNYCSW